MRIKFTFSLVVFLLLNFGQSLHAQLVVADTLANDTLFETLFGNGVTVSNLTFQFCQPSQTGQFNGVNSNLGLDSGVVVSTGNIITAPGPNVSGNTSNVYNSAPVSYPPLSTIAGFPVYDACVIEFDITPLCDTIGISYVFASEEYNEFVSTAFNDAFAFFISGPGFGPAPGQNIALIPGSTTPVTINNVNNGNSPAGVLPAGPCSNCGYYQDNTFGTTVEFDGFTTPLVASAQVIPCETYHITLAIADVSDGSYDSGVFFEIGGIGCITPTLQLSAVNSTVLGSNVAVEGCVNWGLFTFTLPEPLNDTTVFHFTVGGNAIPGVDYQPFPDSIVMPAGVDSISLPVIIYGDSLLEGSEFIEIYYVDSTLCANEIYRDTAVMEIWDQPEIPEILDTSFCSDELVSIGFTPQPNQTYNWSPVAGLSNTSISNPTLSLTYNGADSLNSLYILETTAFQGFCIFRDTLISTVYSGDFAEFTVDTVCFGNENTFSAFANSFVLNSYVWDFGDGQTSTLASPTNLYAQPGNYFAQLITTSEKGCVDTIVHAVLVDSLPALDFSVDPVCEEANSQFVNSLKPGTSYSWSFGDGNTSTAINPIHVYDTFGLYTVKLIGLTAPGCLDSIIREAEVYQNPVADFVADFECFGVPIQYVNQSINGTGNNLTYQWTFGDNNGSTQNSPSHNYGSYGLYPASLTITDELGCTDEYADVIRVYALPEANFDIDPGCANDEFDFISLSTVADNSNITKFHWQYHDDRSNTKASTYRVFRVPGIYTESLRVETEFGCADSIDKELTIYPLPKTFFGRDAVCVYDSTFLRNLSNVADSITNDFIETWTWDLGDGTQVDNVLNPGHAYQDHGTFIITLTNVTDKGCSTVRELPIEIFPLPESPTLIPDTVCFSDPATLLAQTPGSIKRVEWFENPNDLYPFHTGNSYTTPNLPYSQTYYVRSISGEECIGEKVPIQANLHQESFGQILVSQSVIEIPNAIVSFSVEGTILAEEFSWNFGDGNGSDNSNPVHEFEYPGKYEVIVDMIDRYGCEYRLSQVIEVKQLITIFVPSAFSPNGDGFNDALTLGYNLINSVDFQVFNRWGQRVYSSNNLDLQWDGRNENNTLLPEGVYVYHLKAQDFRGNLIQKSGTITLIK